MRNGNGQKDILLEVKNLKVVYGYGCKTFTAVKGISFNIKKRSTLGLVGESGCGKSSTGLAIVRLIKSSSGKIVWLGKNLSDLSDRAFRKYRREIQIIFQNPDSSLNPRLPVKKSLLEALALGKCRDKKLWRDIIAEKLALVGLDFSHAGKYPHELSGGQLQRIGIARALCVEPRLIICDEPVSSLDVSIQAQTLNLLIDLQDRLGLSYLFISHNLAVVRHISMEIAVMQQGAIREFRPAEEVFRNPKHPYTKELLMSVPG